MCRLAAYIGDDIALEDIVTTPPRSLLQQSTAASEAKVAVNGDGFGIAWYSDLPEPGVFRHTAPAWSDANLASLTRHVRSRLFLSHVRAANVGEATNLNCHPFTHGCWSFMHNGQIAHFDRIRRALESRLSDDLYLARRGTTDSELLFLLLLQFGLDRGPERAVSDVIALIGEETLKLGLAPDQKLTCIASDGRKLLAFRHATRTKAPTLYFRRGTSGITLASEPLDEQTATWSAVDADRLLCLTLVPTQPVDVTTSDLETRAGKDIAA